MDDVINQPLFSNSEIEKVKKLKLAGLKQLKDNPLNIAVDEFKGIAFKDSVYGHNSIVLKENIPNISRGDVVEYYNTVLDPKNLVITVAGNVENEKVINKMTKNI